MSLDLCTNFRTNFEHYDVTFAIEKVCCMINKDHYLTKDSQIVLHTLIWSKNRLENDIQWAHLAFSTYLSNL